MWTIRTTLEWTQGHLEAKGFENPRLEAQWLICAATGFSRIEIYTNYDMPLVEAQLGALREGIKRRLAGEPLQYIMGRVGFRHIEVAVRRGVLIPRPETEMLVEVVLAQMGEMGVGAGVAGADAPAGAGPAVARVLDVCTGSGCVALALLDEWPGLSVVATDIDPEAVALARENAVALGYGFEGAPLLVLEDDLASLFVLREEMQGGFDVLVSNPPYVPTGQLAALPKEIAGYESLRALDGGADGLEVFERIAQQAKVLLRPGGLLACELFETKLDDARLLCEAQGFVDVRIYDDLAGRPRIIAAHTAR